MPSTVKEERFSFFQGFSVSAIEDYGDILDSISAFPHDFAEIYYDGIEYIKLKATGSSLDITLINEKIIAESPFTQNPIFNIIWSTNKTYKSAQKIILSQLYPAIHITTKKDTDAFYLYELDDQKVKDMLVNLVDDSWGEIQDKEFKEYIEFHKTLCPVKKLKGNLPFYPLDHNCTTPSLRPLLLYGYGYEKTKKLKLDPSEGEETYISSIEETAKTILNLRKKLDTPYWAIKNDLIIFCPSIYTSLYNVKNSLWKKTFRKLTKLGRDFIKLGIIRNRGYSNIIIHTDEMYNPYEDEIVGPLLLERQKELRFFTKIVSILTTNQFLPAIRLRNSVMLHGNKLKEIADIISSQKPNYLRKLNKKIKIYNESLKKDISNKLLALLKGEQKLLAICDFPIEWICIDEIPIMFTHEISRIGSTPGNLFSELALRGQRIIFHSSLFTKVLVIRSFAKTDRIRKMVENGIEYYQKKDLYKNLSVEIKDVESESDLIAVLNSFDGALVVFDCHGNHGGEDKHGWLKLGNEKVDVWKLANKCRIPPIIMLSACSTHAIDGSHASVANGFLRCGAFSVIGTLAPVDSIHSATLVARLLHRLSDFFPYLLKKRPFTWREFISNLFKMSYVTDVMRHLEMKEKLIDRTQSMDLQLKMNLLINTGKQDWYISLFDLIGETIGKSREDVKQIFREKFQFVETMLYSQLGRPENIVIEPKKN